LYSRSSIDTTINRQPGKLLRVALKTFAQYVNDDDAQYVKPDIFSQSLVTLGYIRLCAAVTMLFDLTVVLHEERGPCKVCICCYFCSWPFAVVLCMVQMLMAASPPLVTRVPVVMPHPTQEQLLAHVRIAQMLALVSHARVALGTAGMPPPTAARTPMNVSRATAAPA
jgi:hypothetical protein